MAKFCIHCGRLLQEGEVCTCQSDAAKAVEEEEGTQILGMGKPVQEAVQEEAKEGPQAPVMPVTLEKMSAEGDGEAKEAMADDQPTGPSAGNDRQQSSQSQSIGNGHQQTPQGNGNPYQQGFQRTANNYQQAPQGAPHGRQQAPGPQGGYRQGHQGGTYPRGPQGQPVQGGQRAYGGGRPVNPAFYSKNGLFLSKLGCLLQGAYKHPAQMLKSFAAAGDMPMILTVMGIEAVLFGLFLVTVFSKIGSTILDMVISMNNLGSYSSSSYSSMMSEVSQVFDFPLVKIFFVALFTAMVIMFAFAGILFLFNKVAFKANATFAQMAGVSAARALAILPFVLVGIIVSLINPIVGLAIYSLGSLLGYFFVATALKSCTVNNETKYIYILFLTFACMVIVNAIIIRVTYTWYLPDYLRMGMNMMNSLY